MRLLPRSHCGTWLLAGAFWLAACVGGRWIQPVLPQAVLRLFEDCELVSLGPDESTAIVLRIVRPHGDHQMELLNLEQIECPSGRLLRTFLSDSPPLEFIGSSADNQYLFFVEQRLPQFRLLRLDLHNSTLTPLVLGGADDNLSYCRLSPDGRFLAVPTRHGEEAGLNIWDAIHDQMVFQMPRAGWQCAFALNRHILVAKSAKPNQIRVVDLHQRESTKLFSGPAMSNVCNICISDDGRYVLGEFELADSNAAGDQVIPLCWDLQSGSTIQAFSPQQCDIRGMRKSGLLVLHGSAYANHEPRCFFWNRNEESGSSLELNWQFAPRGQTVLIPVRSSASFDFQNLLHRIGVTLPTNIDNSVEGKLIRLPECNEIARIPTLPTFLSSIGCVLRVEWAGHGRALAAFDREANTWTIWDVPPRKSLSWFAAGAMIVGVVLWLAARCRIRCLNH